MKFPKHLGLTLEHNPHKLYYETVASFVKQNDRFDGPSDWVSDAERAKAIETDELWTLQWYPDTPVGFAFLQASTLEALMARVEEGWE